MMMQGLLIILWNLENYLNQFKFIAKTINNPAAVTRDRKISVHGSWFTKSEV